MLIATVGGSKVSGTGVIERLNIQMDNGQTVYKNRTLTHNLQQPAQETNPLSTVTSPGSQIITPVATGPKHPGLD